MLTMLSDLAEMELKSTLRAYRDKANLDAYAELYKCGVISRERFIKYARQYISFVPDDLK